MSSLGEDIRQRMMLLLKQEEEKTDLTNLSVLSRVGMKVSSAKSFELDADARSASSTALIDLGLRLSEATNHGSLTEILLHNESGYSILMAINDEYIVFAGLKAVYRVGYYLGYLRELARKLNLYISGDQETEMVLTLEENELEKLRKQKEEEDKREKEVKLFQPSIEEDKAALDNLLGFLDDWEKEGTEGTEIGSENEGNIVSIPKNISTGFRETEMTGSAPQRPKSSTKLASDTGIEVYDDEVPPVPLEDYTPMEVDEEITTQEDYEPAIPIPRTEPELEPSSSEELPSLDELPIPDFQSETASEYDTEFILEEESESLEAVLKELGWTEEE